MINFKLKEILEATSRLYRLHRFQLLINWLRLIDKINSNNSMPYLRLRKINNKFLLLIINLERITRARIRKHSIS